MEARESNPCGVKSVSKDTDVRMYVNKLQSRNRGTGIENRCMDIRGCVEVVEL